jgi:predicted ATPase
MLRKMEADERRPSTQIAELIAGALEIPAAQRSTFVKVARGELVVDRLVPFSVPVQRPGMPPAAASPRNNLPVLPTPLIGRHRELAELCKLVRDPQCRMLTLVGPGGIGKTRLAVEAASQLQNDFADGAYFVPLAPVDASRFIVPVIAHSIGFAFLGISSADPKTQLLNYLEHRRMLLLVDNIEHLLEEPGIELFAQLLAAAPDVKLLVTSREALTLQHEWVFEVKGLPVPGDSTSTQGAQDTSIELFLQRARRAYVGFDATTEDYPAILRICRLVDGVPLAIELAAAWVRTLTCAEIADQIELGLDFLATSARDLPTRHRSMRAVFDHSWKLLSDEERRALASLSVFRGGFDRDAAAHVAGAPLGILSGLVAKSLIRRPEAGRYDLHDLIRQYAALHLRADPGSEAAAWQEHYAFYLSLAEAAAPQLKGSGQLEWLRRLERERDNFRAALSWSLNGGQVDAALRLAAALRWFWGMRGYFDEGHTWLFKALQQSPQESAGVSARARALEGLGLLDNAAGQHADARALAEQSEALFRELGDKQGLADALMVSGQALRWQGEAALSQARLEEALALYRELGDRWNVARCLHRLGTSLADYGGDAAGLLMLEEVSAILDELGDKFMSGGVLVTLGIIAFARGDYASARSRFDRSLVIAQELRDPWGMADALTNSGCVLRAQGNYAAAGTYLEEALQIYEQWGRGTWCADPRCALAENEIAQGHLSAARLHLDEASPCAQTSGNKWLLVLTAYFDGLLTYYEGNLQGAAVLLEKTVALARASQYKPDLARALISLGRVRRAQDQGTLAAAHIVEGLRLFAESGSKLGIATGVEAFAGLKATEAQESAAGWFGAAETIRGDIGAPLPPVDRPGYERDVDAVRAHIGEAGLAKAWARGRAETYETVVADIFAFSNNTN